MAAKTKRATAQVNDQARVAVSEFRKIQPTLTAFARALTRNPRVRVIASTGVPRTDGKDIFYQPPIELGKRLAHDRALCDERDWETMQQRCPACAVREGIFASTYHEISHIAFESFLPPDETRLQAAYRYIREYAPPKYAERVIRKIVESDEIPKSYMALANAISPYFKVLANALEDVRINTRMHRARPGTKAMMDGQIMRVMGEGVVGHDNKTRKWTDMHLNHQASIGAYLIASGFEPQPGWLADEVIEAIRDEQLRDLLVLVPEAANAHESFEASWKVFTRLRELGFYTLTEEQDDDTSDDDESDEPAPTPPTPPTPPPPSPPAASDSSESDGEGSDDSGAGDGGESQPDTEPSDDEDAQGEQPEGESSDEGEDDDSPAGDGEEDEGPGDGEGADDAPEQGDGEADGEAPGPDGSDAPADAPDEESPAEGDADGDADELDDRQPDSDEWSDSDDAEQSESDSADHEGPEAGESGEPEQPDDEPGPGDGAGDGDSPGDGFRVEPSEDAEEEELDLGDLGLHAHREETTEQEDGAIEVAIVQGEYFESPSANILGVNEWEYDTRESDAVGRRYHAWPRFGSELVELPGEDILGPALMRMRLVFAENKRTIRNRNQRSGRLDARVLGRRGWNDDDRLFGKKVIPGKRDYVIYICIDVSGSTAFGDSRGEANIRLIKAAAMAQAELCARMGLRFAVVGHTGSPRTESERGGFGSKNLWLDIYHIKHADEPWDDKTKQRLADIGPSYSNLDGHTLEFLRRRIERESQTDKVILYYSDGKMPMENFHEELGILQREIATCKQKGITLMGVGIRTDSPAQHGLDTVQVDDSADIGRVVQHLERRLVG